MSEKPWPEAHPDVIRTSLPYQPDVLGVRVLTSVDEWRAAMQTKPGQTIDAGALAQIDRIAGLLEQGHYVLMLEAYPEAYAMLLQSLQRSYGAMVPFVAGRRVKRHTEN